MWWNDIKETKIWLRQLELRIFKIEEYIKNSNYDKNISTRLDYLESKLNSMINENECCACKSIDTIIERKEVDKPKKG